jgi:hypothetical protein
LQSYTCIPQKKKRRHAKNKKKESKKIPGHPLSPMNLFFPTRFEETESFHSLQPTFLYYRFFSSDSSTSPLTARPPVRAGNSIGLQNPKKAEKEQKRGRDQNLKSTQNRVTKTTHPPTTTW